MEYLDVKDINDTPTITMQYNNELKHHLFNQYFNSHPKTFNISENINVNLTVLFNDRSSNILVMKLDINNINILVYHTNDNCGSGNIILRYYFYRSFAFFLDFKFIMIVSKEQFIQDISMLLNHDKRWCDVIKKHIIKYMDDEYSVFDINKNINKLVNTKYYHKNDTILYYLPTFCDKTMNDYIGTNESLLQIHKYIHKQLLIKEYYNDIFYNEFMRLPWRLNNVNHLFYSNDFIRKTFIQPELLSGLTHIKEYMDISQNNTKSVDMNSSVVIHFRCGDYIKFLMDEAGFPGLSYYKKLFNEINVYNKTVILLFNILDNNNDYKSKNSHFNINITDHKRCRTLWNKIKPRFDDILHKYGHKMILIDKGTWYNDLYYLINSKYVVCYTSTFCELGMYLNKNAKTLFYVRNSPYFMNKNFMNLHPKGLPSAQFIENLRSNINYLSGWIIRN